MSNPLLLGFESRRSISRGTSRFSRLRRFIPGLCLTVYPVWFMFVPLTSSAITQVGRGTSDINGAILRAQVLATMQWPWSETSLVGGPAGESFWNLWTLKNPILWIALWLPSQVLSPDSAVALLVIVGWIVTGLGVYLVARRLGASQVTATLSGVIGQMLPWMQEKAAAHLTYMFSGLILVGMVAAADCVVRSNRRTILVLLSTNICALGVDLYLFYFTLIGQVVVWLFLTRRTFIRGAIVGLLVAIGTLAVVIRLALANHAEFFPLLVKSAPAILTGRPWIATPDTIKFWTSDLIDYIRPHPYHMIFDYPWRRAIEIDFISDHVNYLGVVVLALSVVGVVVALRTSSRRTACAFLAAAGIFILLSINFPLVGLGVAELVSVFTPGARVYSRAGLPAELIAAAFCAVALDAIVRRIKSKRVGMGLTLSIFVLAVLDLNPLGGSKPVRERAAYETFRTALTQVIYEPSVLILPTDIRWYVDGSFLDSNLVNSFSNSERLDFLTDKQLSTPESLFCSIVPTGATHVLLPVGPEVEVYSRVDYADSFTPPYFHLIAVSKVQGIYSGTKVDLALFEVALTDAAPFEGCTIDK